MSDAEPARDRPDGTEPGTTFFADVEPGRKGEILDSALHVFAERGYDNGSMREIAKGVGVSEPALYRHFPGKEALFLALIRAGAGRMRNEAFALIDDLRPETVREQLLGMFDNRRRALAAQRSDAARGHSRRGPQHRLPRGVPLGHRRARPRPPRREGGRARRGIRRARRRRHARARACAHCSRSSSAGS